MNEMEIRNKFLKGNRAKIKLAWTATIAAIIFIVIFSFINGGNNTHTQDWVIDGAEILSDATIASINEKCGILYAEKGTEFLVVVEKDSGNNRNLEKRAKDLFEKNNVSSNGILLIMAVPAESSGIGAFIDGFLDALLGGRSAYHVHFGRNADDTLDHKLERFDGEFFGFYDAGMYNMAVSSMVDNIYYNHFGGRELLDNTAHSIAPTYVPYDAGAAVVPFLSTVSIIILVVLLIMVFSRKRRVYTPRRVYRSRSWFGPGFGLGMGAGMLMNSQRTRNTHRYKTVTRNSRGGTGGSFGGFSSSGRSGGSSRSSSGRTGGSSRGGGFSSSGRSGGSSRSGGFGGSGRSGGSSRGGGVSRGGGRRR